MSTEKHISQQSYTTLTPEEIERQQRLIRGEEPFATGGLITAPLTVADLSAKHIGKTMRITNGTDVFTGHLTGIEFKVDRRMCGDSASAVRALFDDSHVTYPLTATVEVL